MLYQQSNSKMYKASVLQSENGIYMPEDSKNEKLKKEKKKSKKPILCNLVSLNPFQRPLAFDTDQCVQTLMGDVDGNLRCLLNWTENEYAHTADASQLRMSVCRRGSAGSAPS